ncbi:tetratricopeptide repeat protein [Corynebacterium epidermidicanis]|uniref:Thioredoxin domain-containing protein n=1 Tax=Corynebacterium epidermidicanis TaxID=1050174 RepID=A0A0G3GTL7_9CORY|nr:tetratricopeptide repeat protein [Corynebacterium epidermidicanis]AKK02898.1 thioredoxin domain-containing protein [Corynebacterium epidermidicanis]
MANFVPGAIDLAEVKARAEAKAAATASGGADIPTAITVTQENIETEVVGRSMQVPVIVLIGTARSEDSEALRLNLTNLAAQANRAWIFAYLDADATPHLAQALGVTGLPTVLALADGRPLADFQGGQPLEALQQWTVAVVNAVAGKLAGLPANDAEATPEDPRFAPANEALNRGDFDAAIAVYDAILAQEPANKEAKQARDNARLLGRLAGADRSVDAVAASDAAPGNVSLAFAAADALIARAEVDAAFDRLIALLPNNEVRDRLLELFSVFEPGDPRVKLARTKMASKLF